VDIVYRLCPAVTSAALNTLFGASWPDHEPRDYTPNLQRSLTYVCAYESERLIGFVNVAWDGGSHAFLLDPTVHPDLRRQGVGSELVRRAASAARARGAVWLHVDYEPALEPFYRHCGFHLTEAGLMNLQWGVEPPDSQTEADRDRTDAHRKVLAQTRMLICHRCRRETRHTWRRWRPWHVWPSRRQWMEGWLCEQCGARRFVWRVKRARR
jgi:GNAT superfamily N-acetyltransferase